MPENWTLHLSHPVNYIPTASSAALTLKRVSPNIEMLVKLHNKFWNVMNSCGIP